MPQFRKKPVVVEAMQFDGTPGSAVAVFDAFGAHMPRTKFLPNFNDLSCGGRLVIPTLEGDMTASPGDWIIRGVQGEVYPCKPDIFAQTYEPADTPSAPALRAQEKFSAVADTLERLTEEVRQMAREQ